jgi:hypothetical protein
MKTLATFTVGALAALLAGAVALGTFLPNPINTIAPIDIDSGSDDAILRRGDDDDGELDVFDDEQDDDLDTLATPSPTATPTATRDTRDTDTLVRPRPTATDDTADTDTGGDNSGPGSRNSGSGSDNSGSGSDNSGSGSRNSGSGSGDDTTDD